jgi:hypothetical protein
MMEVNTIELTKEEQMRFAEAIINPPPMSPALLRAFEAHDKLVESDIGKLNFDKLPAYEADDGDLTVEQMTAIRKAVPQLNVKLVKSLFGEE